MRLLKLSLILLFTSTLAYGQNKLESDPGFGFIKITGTSSLHDWEEQVTEYRVIGVKKDQTIENLEVKVTTKSLESGKSIMDDKTFEALKADKYPHIILKSTSIVMNNGQISGKGTLELAGAKREIPIKAEYTNLTATALKINGVVSLKMTDFGIDPPTAMFGTMTTGDEVSIIYEIKLNIK